MMPKEPVQNTDSTVIYIGGKKTTIGEVQKSHATLLFLSKPSAIKIAEVLLNSKEPLTREQIANQAKLSVGYTIDVLNTLLKYDYIVPFRISNRRLIFYAVTEKGFNALENKSKGATEK